MLDQAAVLVKSCIFCSCRSLLCVTVNLIILKNDPNFEFILFIMTRPSEKTSEITENRLVNPFKARYLYNN